MDDCNFNPLPSAVILSVFCGLQLPVFFCIAHRCDTWHFESRGGSVCVTFCDAIPLSANTASDSLILPGHHLMRLRLQFSDYGFIKTEFCRCIIFFIAFVFTSITWHITCYYVDSVVIYLWSCVRQVHKEVMVRSINGNWTWRTFISDDKGQESEPDQSWSHPRFSLCMSPTSTSSLTSRYYHPLVLLNALSKLTSSLPS